MAEAIEPVRVYVGADRSQRLAAKVLEYSIARRTELPVAVKFMDDLDLPRPQSKKNQPRTGFSFARFAIPALAGRRGHALYVDADMLVLKDVAELWHWPMKEFSVQIQGSEEDRHSDRPKQCSVMLLDCAKLDWDVNEIVAGLDGQYDYAQLMGQLCILPRAAIGYDLPFRWNSLEHYDATTGLIHYTDMLTQPWVSLDNQNGEIWVNELRDMLLEGRISRDVIEKEIILGHVRPSLLAQLDNPALPMETLQDIDDDAEFVAHAAFTAALRPSIFSRVKRRLFG